MNEYKVGIMMEYLWPMKLGTSFCMFQNKIYNEYIVVVVLL